MAKKTAAAETPRPKPVHVIQMSPFRVSIWANKGRENDTFYSMTWQRSYMDSEGRWQHSNSASANNIGVLIAALEAADKWMRLNPS